MAHCFRKTVVWFRPQINKWPEKSKLTLYFCKAELTKGGRLCQFHKTAQYQWIATTAEQTLNDRVSANVVFGLDFEGVSANFTADCFPSSSSESSSSDAPKNLIRGRTFLDSAEWRFEFVSEFIHYVKNVHHYTLSANIPASPRMLIVLWTFVSG